jgi:hypothetical protein
VMRIITEFTASLDSADRTKIWIQNAVDYYQLKL